jgi:hypothetical protein
LSSQTNGQTTPMTRDEHRAFQKELKRPSFGRNLQRLIDANLKPSAKSSGLARCLDAPGSSPTKSAATLPDSPSRCSDVSVARSITTDAHVPTEDEWRDLGRPLEAGESCGASDRGLRCAREKGHDGLHDCGWSFA